MIGNFAGKAIEFLKEIERRENRIYATSTVVNKMCTETSKRCKIHAALLLAFFLQVVQVECVYSEVLAQLTDLKMKVNLVLSTLNTKQIP